MTATPAVSHNGRVVCFAIESPADICPEGGGGHYDKPVDETAAGYPIYGCTQCGREVEERPDGSYGPRATADDVAAFFRGVDEAFAVEMGEVRS